MTERSRRRDVVCINLTSRNTVGRVPLVAAAGWPSHQPAENTSPHVRLPPPPLTSDHVIVMWPIGSGRVWAHVSWVSAGCPNTLWTRPDPLSTQTSCSLHSISLPTERIFWPTTGSSLYWHWSLLRFILHTRVWLDFFLFCCHFVTRKPSCHKRAVKPNPLLPCLPSPGCRTWSTFWVNSKTQR